MAALSTVLGGLVPLKMKIKRKNLLYPIAVAAGVLIGISFLEIIPEAMELSGFAGFGLVSGFLIMYVIEHFSIAHASMEFECKLHRISLVAFAGLLFHSFIDGIAIASGFLVSYSFGLSMSLAVLLHEFPEGLAASSLLLATRYSKTKIFSLVLAVALATPLGAGAFLIFKSADILPIALGIAAGSFIYIGSADLLPQLHKKKSGKIFFSFMLGIFLILLSSFLAI